MRDNHCVGSYTDHIEQSHAKNITLWIDKLLKENNLDFKSMTFLAINEGPGSFTGLRVGSSVAKGICFAWDIPLVKIKGLEAYGKYFYQFFKEKYTDIFILLDARRDHYFYTHISKGHVVKEILFEHISAIENQIKICSTPWVYKSNEESVFRFESSYLMEAALEKWQNKELEDIVHFEPNYMLNNYQPKR